MAVLAHFSSQVRGQPAPEAVSHPFLLSPHLFHAFYPFVYPVISSSFSLRLLCPQPPLLSHLFSLPLHQQSALNLNHPPAYSYPVFSSTLTALCIYSYPLLTLSSPFWVSRTTFFSNTLQTFFGICYLKFFSVLKPNLGLK